MSAARPPLERVALTAEHLEVCAEFIPAAIEFLTATIQNPENIADAWAEFSQKPLAWSGAPTAPVATLGLLTEEYIRRMRDGFREIVRIAEEGDALPPVVLRILTEAPDGVNIPDLSDSEIKGVRAFLAGHGYTPGVLEAEGYAAAWMRPEGGAS